MGKGPTYYQRGLYQPWDFIRDQGLNYHLGNAIKYICRAGYKDSKVKDLQKAIHYLENELEHTLNDSQSERPSPGISASIWGQELQDEPDYATAFDR
jgi:hypothetical protein